MGLSPRLRGNRVQDHRAFRSAGGRSIPAPAGEPYVAENLRRRIASGSIPAPAGEPPTSTPSPAVGDIRSIPAPAGEPWHPAWSWKGPELEVYPRACGGTDRTSWQDHGHALRMGGSIPAPAGEPTSGTVAVAIRPGAVGLSPRLRGNHLQGLVRRSTTGMRSIPAPAGEPSISATVKQSGSGLSPRLRGNPC